ncbi:MAG: EF-hand domain-containing protein [Candidatus Krumholzibacteria bacterium]|nr:EF-hand domain-containing protein [Candidatus Krumholzibacteria bacterium]
MISSISGLSSGMTAMQGARPGPKPEAIFSEIDADEDGKINTTEVQSMVDHMFEKMGAQAPSAEEFMAQMDTDGDGTMSFAEFEAGRPPGPPPGGGQGMMPPGMQLDDSGEMDLSSLFNTGEEEDSSSYESLYA